MRYIFLCLILLSSVLCSCESNSNQPPKEESMSHPVVTFRTNLGSFEVELFEDKAPLTVQNFLRYVEEKHYNNTIFHRVIDGFMIQGGGFTANMDQKPTHEPIRNEADNRIPNTKGTIAMARTSDVHSASSQFFINVVDNPFLNFRAPTTEGFGYCVFGQVISGMDVVDKIKAAKTGTKKGHQNVPNQNIEILEITLNPKK